MEDKREKIDDFPKVIRKHSYEEFAKKIDGMSLEDLRKLMELGDHDYTYIENPNMDRRFNNLMKDKDCDFELGLGDTRLDNSGMDDFKNPNKDKVTAYTDEYGVRLGMFIDDKDKGRRR